MKVHNFFLAILMTFFLVACSSSRVITPDITEPISILYDSRPEECPELTEINDDWTDYQKIKTIALNCAQYKLWGETWKDYAERLESFQTSLSDILNK